MATIQPPVEVYDDLDFREHGDQVPATVKRVLALDGDEVSLDLTEEHAIELDNLLVRYFKVGTKVEKVPTKRGRKNSARAPHTPERERSAEIREWATSQGIKISERGRVPENAKAAFYQAFPDKRPLD